MEKLSPYHEGEQRVQKLTGEQDTALMNAGVIADRIPAGAKTFVTQQQHSVLSWSGTDENIWATLLIGTQGFATTNEDLTELHFQLSDESGVLTKVPPFSGLREGDNVGALFIELSTRRRLRVNGRAVALTDEELTIEVRQAYPNCPKYIQRRPLVEAAPPAPDTTVREGSGLTDDLVVWIANADTFFVASAHPDGSMDASHRGGKPGFVSLQNGVLRIPDYPGNSIFNTLGNFTLNPRAGLTFVDFENGRQLQMTGDVRLDLQAGDSNGETGGTGRWWDFHPRRWIVSPLNKPMAWGTVDPSPFNPGG